MVMEFLFIIVIGVILVVQFAMKQRGKEHSSGPRSRGESRSKNSPRQRQRQRPRPQTVQPKSLDEALRLSEDRPAPPALRFAGRDDTDDAGDESHDAGGAEAPTKVPDTSSMHDEESGRHLSTGPGPGPRAEPVGVELEPVQTDAARIERAGGESAVAKPAAPAPVEGGPVKAEPFAIGAADALRPAEPFSPAYSATVYTPTSVYTSGTSILDGEKRPESGEASDGGGAREQEPDADQRS